MNALDLYPLLMHGVNQSMSDLTFTLSQLRAQIGYAYTRQRLYQMSDFRKTGLFAKLPGVTCHKKGKGNVIVIVGGRALRLWIKKTKGRPKASAAETTDRPLGEFLKATQLAKMARMSPRQIGRLSETELSQWHYPSKGRHHIFLDNHKLRRWAKRKATPPSPRIPATPWGLVMRHSHRLKASIQAMLNNKPLDSWPNNLRSGMKMELDPIIKFYQSL